MSINIYPQQPNLVNTVLNGSNGQTSIRYVADNHQYTEFNGMTNGQTVGIYTALSSTSRIRIGKIIFQMGSNTNHDGGWILLQWRNSAGTSTIDLTKLYVLNNQIVVLDFDNCTWISPYTGGRLQITNQTGETYDLHANVFTVEV